MRYEPGTRYSNSTMPDIATDRVNQFGDTIFMQHREDGTPTGRETVVIDGKLYGAELAEKVHAENTRDAAPELLAALQVAVRHAREAMPASDRVRFDAGEVGPEWMFSAKNAIAQALR